MANKMGDMSACGINHSSLPLIQTASPTLSLGDVLHVINDVIGVSSYDSLSRHQCACAIWQVASSGSNMGVYKLLLDVCGYSEA